MNVRECLNILIFFVVVLLIASGLKFRPTLSFLGLVLLLTLLPSFMLRFSEVFSKTSTLAGIFVLGLVINASIGTILLQTKDIKLGIALSSLLPLTLILIPDVFATSLLIRAEASKKEIFAFYFWFLLSVGLAILFLLPTGNATHGNPFMQNIAKDFPAISLLVMYLELILIPSTFCLIYRHLKTFLIFTPMPVVLGYAMSFSLG